MYRSFYFYIGIFQAVPKENEFGITDYYVDGGVLCNYPIMVWDGKIAIFPVNYHVNRELRQKI